VGVVKGVNQMERKGDGQLALPGEEVGTVEEFIPGFGTFDDNGVIRASLSGTVKVNTERRTVSIDPRNEPLTLRKGMELFCVVRDSKDNGAMVDIAQVIGNPRGIAGSHDGLIHVSMIDNRFINHPKDEFKVGDIVRAKVVQSYPSVRLATDAPHYGVVRALCTECRGKLRRKGEELQCEVCERVEHRKFSDDYGNVEKW